MQIYRINFYKILAITGGFLLVIPKYNIVSIAGQTAGLRIDDILILISCFVLAVTYLKTSFILNSFGYYNYIFASLLSVFFSSLYGWPSSFIYPIRLIEYSIFLYYGFLFSKYYNVNNFIIFLYLTNGSVMMLQFLGIVGGFTAIGYTYDVGRVVGLTAGPWEIGYMLDLMLIIILWGNLSKFRSILIIISTFILVLLTGSRSSIFCYMVISLSYFFKRLNIINIILFLILFLIFIIVMQFFGSGLENRNINLFNFENISYAIEYFQNISSSGSFDQSIFDSYSEVADVDPSWLIRSTHWAIAFKEWVSSPTILLIFGLGSGTFGPALDGALTRILVETGIAGFAFYIIFLVRSSSQMKKGGLILFSTIINMVFIDIHLSYKSMALYLFVLGYYINEKYYKK